MREAGHVFWLFLAYFSLENTRVLLECSNSPLGHPSKKILEILEYYSSIVTRGPRLVDSKTVRERT